jgi:cytidylate kinase
MIILGNLFGITGLLYSGPVADAIAFTLSAIMLVVEVKHLNGNKQVKNHSESADVVSKDKSSNNFIITISREYGSGGRYIGKLIAENLGIKLYDKEFVEKVATETGLSEEYIENNEQKRDTLAGLNNGYYFGLDNSDDLFLKESELIKKIAENESCVIVGRCANFILADKKNVLKVFIYSDKDNKIKRATEFYGLSKSNAEKEIKRIDKLRANHYKYYTEKEWKDVTNYDICVNSDLIGVENVADMICGLVEKDRVNN